MRMRSFLITPGCYCASAVGGCLDGCSLLVFLVFGSEMCVF